jgi:GT2 family glycosyltransferase/glycosyltransferase involved in cell wall biosynthesis
MTRVSTAEIQALLDSGVFDSAWYQETYADVRLSNVAPAEHYLWLGRKLGRQPNGGLVSPGLGNATMPVPALVPLLAPAQLPPAGLAKPSNPPLVDDLHGFDARSYVLANPDLQSLKTEFALASHWLEHGRHEGRLGSGVNPFANRKRVSGSRRANSSLRVAFYGPVSAESGLGSAARGYVKALSLLDIDLEVIDSTPSLYPGQAGQIPPPQKRPDILILHQNADSLGNLFKFVSSSILDDAYVIGIWVWELIWFPPEWRASFAAIDEVWAPSEFVAQSIGAVAPSAIRVRVVPHAVEALETVPVPQRSEFGIPEDAFVFLCTFDVSSALERKNPIAVLDSFTEAFADREDVFLVMKYHSSTGSADKVKAMRRKYAAFNIIFIDLILSRDRLNILKESCDCVVSAHRSEGFGLNIAEAMLAGKPVIATGYSGNMQFCTEGNSYLVPYKLAGVPEGTPHYRAGTTWSEPDHVALTMLMQRLESDREEAKRVGRVALDDVGTALSAPSIASTIQKAFVEAGSILTDGFEPSAEWEWRRRMAWTDPAASAKQEFLDGSWPLISVIVPVYNIEPELLEACLQSVLSQSYPYWELCICDDASTNARTKAYIESLRGSHQKIRVRVLPKNLGISGSSNAAAEMASGEFLAFLDNDDVIEPDSLAEFAKEIRNNPGCDLLYCDEDKISLSGDFVDHYFKPDWSPDHLESCMYVLHMITVRKNVFFELGGYREEFTGAQDYDLALRISALGGEVIHVPKVLYHWRMIEGSASAQVDAKPTALVNAKRALADYARRRYGPDAKAEDGAYPGLFRVTRGHIVRPPVTLVMTTNNSTKEVEGRGVINLPGHFLKSIVDRTDYDNYRVIVSSNGALSEACRSLLREIGGREVVYQGPSDNFNFADKANFSILKAETEIVVLLNDDMEVRDRGWLNALVDQIVKEDVGAVGSHLCYADGRIQHVGMALGVNETSAHLYHGSPGEIVGYNGYPAIIRNYSAVTGACMATKRSMFKAVGGFDTSFAIDFNDTDYCLRLGEAGYRIVYTPFAKLYHFESQTAVRYHQNPSEKALFLSRWAHVIERDPFYNPNLRKDSITFEPLESVWPRHRV